MAACGIIQTLVCTIGDRATNNRIAGFGCLGSLDSLGVGLLHLQTSQPVYWSQSYRSFISTLRARRPSAVLAILKPTLSLALQGSTHCAQNKALGSEDHSIDGLASGTAGS